jgi:hypothetical protein
MEGVRRGRACHLAVNRFLILKKCEGHNDCKTEDYRTATNIKEQLLCPCFTALRTHEDWMVVWVYARFLAF